MSANHETHYEYERPAEDFHEWIQEIMLDGVLGAILLLLAWFVFVQIYPSL